MFKVQILGRLGRDAAIYETANGSKFLAFTLAVNSRFLGKESTYWVDVRSFNPSHLKLKEYLTKGKMMVAGGNYACSTTTDKTGKVRLTHTVLADYLDFVNSGGSRPEVQQSEVKETSDDTTPSTPTSNTPNDEDGIVMVSTPITNVEADAVSSSVGAGGSISDDLPF